MAAGAQVPDDALSDETDAQEPDFANAGAAQGARWPAALAIMVVIAWSSFFGWAMRGQIAALGAQPQLAPGMIAQWAVPVLLTGVVWLIAMRHSRAEAARFADSAAALRLESAALEKRLITVNRELSLAREFLAAQSQELDALGRIAVDRISRHAGELQGLIQTNGAEVNAIAATSESALANMNRLRDDLPVVANSARDATNQIGNAGRMASEQLDRLIAGFDRLNQFGTATASEVGRLEQRVGETIGSFATQLDRVNQVATSHLAATRGEAEAFAQQIETAEAAAQLQLKDRFATLHHEMVEKLALVEDADRAIASAAEERLDKVRAEMAAISAQIAAGERHFAEALEQRQEALAVHEAQASEALAQRLAEFDDALAQRREAQIAETEKLVAYGSDLAGQLDALSALISKVEAATTATHAQLDEGIAGLTAQLAAERAALAATQSELALATDAGVRLLEIIQSGARFAREDLNGGIAGAASQIESVQGSAEGVARLMLQSTNDGAKLGDYLVTTREAIAAADASMRDLAGTFAAQNEDVLARLQGLRGGFAQLSQESGALAQSSQEALRTSLGEIEAAIAASLAALEETTTRTLPALAETMGADAVAVLERALRIEAAATIGKLEQSAAHASGIGREAMVQLRDQLSMVNELTGNLEQRVARARELAEEQVNNDFARRMALITESLNSAAIDIASAISTEVSDTAWEAYLKGDRGIFTRRAVRLIDAGTTREITEMYQRDEAFRSHVSRYIHDFEAMLRSLLSARGGNVMSVTMLGSDMGKLYVVLAQAIQRLRN